MTKWWFWCRYHLAGFKLQRPSFGWVSDLICTYINLEITAKNQIWACKSRH